ncbi:MAG: hypothetical protein IT428_20435 [Planctomycetaceae bacterium]|nr:hypothetical protein [Planctomycetaceae bacterium]
MRPGTGSGTSAGNTTNVVGARPGTGSTTQAVPPTTANRPGVGAGGVGGPASGIGVLPGAGAGLPGVPAAAQGTRYTSNSALNAQAASVRAAAVANPTYNTASFAAYGNAWQPTNLAAASVYSNPGYGAVAAGVGLSAQPVAYDYGANVVAQPTTVYVNGDSAGTPQQYASQASAIAAAGASAHAAPNSKWIPLGVFALVQGDATTSDDVFQLAVNADGIIQGNYHNVRSDQMESVAGSVDKKTQRAAWTIGGDKSPVYEAGIANLTKEATPILVHLEDGRSNQLTLVRLQQPQP